MLFQKILTFAFLLFFLQTTDAQSLPNYSVQLKPIAIPGLGGVQSYAFGQHNGKWLIVGGRLDGLHRRQPWASFDLAGHNNQLIVIDPTHAQQWTAPLTVLPDTFQEALSATNMEFFQEGKFLYCLGGYGYSPTNGDHITFPTLTAIDVPAVIQTIISGDSLQANQFRQLTDTLFQVTGGRLRKIENEYYLMGGQKFMGRYNPMGPNHGPGFLQEYTNSIRKFTLSDDGVEINITHLPGYTDPAYLHRRDYNAEAQILPNGEEGITLFSGVFQYNSDLPFLDCINVDAADYYLQPDFQQLLNHYHCPTLPLYEEKENRMHTLFFGGIAQFYESDGVLVQDDNVPFVKTIARVTREKDGSMAEYKLPVEMPALIGAGAELIPAPDLPMYPNGVLNLDECSSDTILAGHIFGGIESQAPNIFFINDGNQSIASAVVFEVLLIKKAITTSTQNSDSQKEVSFTPIIYPNPNQGILYVDFDLPKRSDVTLTVSSWQGKIVANHQLHNQTKGPKSVRIDVPQLQWGATYLLTIKTRFGTVTRKIIVQE